MRRTVCSFTSLYREVRLKILKRPMLRLRFTVSAPEDVQFTLELEPESEYEVLIDGESAGKMNTNLSGKLSVSVELSADQSAAIKVVKC